MPGCGAALTQSGDVGAPSCPQSNPHPGVSDAPGVTLGIGPYPSSSPVVTATVSVGARVVQNEAALGQLSQKAVLGEMAGKRGRVRPPCWPPHPLLLSCSLHRGHGSGVWQRKRMKKPGEPSPRSPTRGTGSPAPAGCCGPCLGPRQVHQGKRCRLFCTLFLMAGHFLSLSSIAGKGSERKTEPFFIFLPFAISLRSQKAILRLIFLPPFTWAFCKGTGIPL